jgi:hypothetical protein
MPWEGYTHFRVIDVGTSIRFVESRAVLGVPPAPIQVGAQMRIVLGGSAPAIVVTIIATGENELQIRTPDGIVWQMTHHTPKDFPVFQSQDLNFQDWVVRGKLEQ